MSDNCGFDDQSQRLFSRRAREIREEGGVPSAWFPSTIKQPVTPSRIAASDSSGPKISPEQKVLTDLANVALGDGTYRRARAGTVPSSFGGSSDNKITANSPRNFSPYVSNSSTPNKENDTLGALPELRASQNNSPSRLRAGSLTLPQSRNAYSSAFGPSIFSSSWSQRVNNQHLPSSPAQSNFSREDDQTPIKTLDYLGLAETPTPPRPLTNVSSMGNTTQQTPGSGLTYSSDINGLRRDANRIRSYSVNAKERYDDEYDTSDMQDPSGTSHDFSYNDPYRMSATPSRPRSRTTGILDSPPSARTNKFAPMHSHMENSVTAADLDGYPADQNYHVSDMSGRINHISHEHIPRYDDGSAGIGGYIQSQPTRALWLGNIPSTTPSAALLAMFSPFGTIESARVLTHKSCAFVNFELLESAIIARTAFNGKELFPGAGPVRIGFAKVPSNNTAVTPEPYNVLDADPPSGTQHSELQDAKPPTVEAMQNELVALVAEYSANDEERQACQKTIEQAAQFADSYEEVPVMPEPSGNRKYDAPKLRDIRKRIDNGDWTQAEIEEIAIDMLAEIADLSADYLGNTVVQKLFEFCSESVKLQMLDHITPHLPEIGVHKNGTWAAQKIIDAATTPMEMSRVSGALRRCTPALFLDQFGNYVIQCCLKFGPEFNDFVFQAMLSHTWEIAQGRYGARAMRACLESHHTSKAQQRLLAAVITIHSVQLATNANGALLLTWLLDTCTLPNRHRLLAPKLAQHLVHLCTHKLASLTVLKVINQRQEPEARDLILDNLFFSENDKVLQAILQDQAHGATVVFKIITTPYLDAEIRQQIIANIRTVIQHSKIAPGNGFKRLMDEVGLSTRGLNSMNSHEAPRSGYSPQYSTSQFGTTHDLSSAGPRSLGLDPATMHALGDMGMASGNTAYELNANQMQQHLQYQAMLQQSLRTNQYGYPHQQQQQQHQQPPYNMGYGMHNPSYGAYSASSYPHQPSYPQTSSPRRNR